MGARLTVVSGLAAFTVAAGAGALATGSIFGADRPSQRELDRTQARINQHWRSDALARQGIYVVSTGQPAGDCVVVTLLNPTDPNRQYLRRRFGPYVCVDRMSAYPSACAGYEAPPLPDGPIRVPDVRDLGIYAAERRITGRGLTYALRCLGDRKERARRPERYSAEQHARVSMQCPRPGELVPAGTEVALGARAILPGGFPFRTGTLHGPRSCPDGRNVRDG